MEDRIHSGCDICRGEEFDRESGRVLVWQNDLWRLATSTVAPVAGFSYLEPRRHIAHVTDLDGPEAATFGPTLAAVTRTLKLVAEADLVYALIFGERIAHLHVNLVPHRAGDGTVGGAGLFDPAAAPVPAAVHTRLVDRLHTALLGFAGS